MKRLLNMYILYRPYEKKVKNIDFASKLQYISIIYKKIFATEQIFTICVQQIIKLSLFALWDQNQRL
jgi:hypothetical protein